MTNILKRLLFLTLFVSIYTSFGTLNAQTLQGGFYRNFNAIKNSKSDALLIGRNRLVFDLGKDLSNGQIFISGQILNTYSDSLTNLTSRLNEAYFDLYFSKFDLRIGKQIIAFGRTEGSFITDIITPLDLSEFLTQPVDVIQTGIPSAKLSWYFGSNYLEAVFSPISQSNLFARPGDTWFPFQQFNDINVDFTGGGVNETRAIAQGSIRFALRNSLKYDLDLIAMYWTPGNPSFKKDINIVADPIIPSARLALDATYLVRPIIAYSGNYIVNDNLILKSESAFHFQQYFDYLPPTLRGTRPEDLGLQDLVNLNAEFDSNTDGFLKKKPWLVGMIGAQLSFAGYQSTIQVINEHIFNYEDILLQDQNYTLLTFQFRKAFLGDKLTTSAFYRYQINGKDMWISPEFSYDLNDNIKLSLGSQIFLGAEYDLYYGHFSFSDYESNSFIFTKITSFF